MRILFLHSGQQDYLADALFHGLREIPEVICVDVPKYTYMYEPLSDVVRTELRGHGFTLYGLLPDSSDFSERRVNWGKELGDYDVVIIANIWRQIDQYLELSRQIDPRKMVILDGADASECFPYASRLRSRPSCYFTPIRKSLYFKRELLPAGESFGPARYLPTTWRRRFGTPPNVVSLGFSIPAGKITPISPLKKKKQFNQDIVDSELAESERAQDMRSHFYPFQQEEEYYGDLQVSRFGITTRRAGWDCLRHYEIAANGTVIAFRQLDHKPESCSPRGLNRDNCLIYQDRTDLMNQIAQLTEERYAALQGAGYAWVRANTTVRRAEEFLKRYRQYGQEG